MYEEGQLKLSESELKLMLALREDYKKQLHLRKQKRKELVELHKSSEYLKMMEQKIEIEEKELELNKMRDCYLELKTSMKHGDRIKENEELKKGIQRLQYEVSQNEVRTV